MGKIIDADDAIKAIQGLPRWILDPKGEFQPVEPTTKAMIDPDDAVAAIENLPLAKPGFDSVVKLDKAFDDGYKQGYLQAESDLSISQPHENDRLNNQVHLCNSCKYDFPDCPSKNDDIVFGNGVGDDNIVLAVNTCRPYSRGGR